MLNPGRLVFIMFFLFFESVLAGQSTTTTLININLQAWPCSDCFTETASGTDGVGFGGYGGMGMGLGGGTPTTLPGMGGAYGGAGFPGTMGNSEPPKSTPGKMSDTLQTVVDNIPSLFLDQNEKGAFKEYLKMLGGGKYSGDRDVGAANTGLNSYFSDLWGTGKFGLWNGSDKISNLNQCFRDKAMNFYRDVALYLKSHQPSAPCDEGQKQINKQFGCVVDYPCSKERPPLLSKVGKGDREKMEPGWLWKLALKNSNGNSNAALHLIGMCGHDDTMQSSFNFFDSSESSRSELRDQLAELEKQKTKLEFEVKQAAKNVDTDPNRLIAKSQEFSNLMTRIGSLKRAKGQSRFLNCPPKDSDFYLPGSLSEEADISSDLKTKINRVQNPDGKAKIPAKHYHVYGSALMACQLISNGFDPEKAVKVQKQAARFYRGVRMCGAVEPLLQQNDKLQNLLIPAAKKEGLTLDAYVVKQLSSIDLFKGPVCPENDKEKYKTCNALLEMFGDANYGMKQDPEIAKRKINNRLARIDAAFLYKSWYLGGDEVFGKKIPCTDIKLHGPSDLMNPNAATLSWFQRPSGWSKERYEAATRHLATWDVDFQWTIAQHEAGAKFAAKECKKGKPGENPFQNLCTETTPASQQKNDGHSSETGNGTAQSESGK